MKPAQMNMITGAVLLALGLWGYFTSTSSTALIAPAFGLLFLALSPLFNKGNKIVVHVVVLFTVLLTLMFIMPFRGAIGRGDTLAMVRVGLMLLTTAVASVVYIKSFIDARKNRA